MPLPTTCLRLGVMTMTSDLGQSVCRICGEPLLPEEIAEERQTHCICAMEALPVGQSETSVVMRYRPFPEGDAPQDWPEVYVAAEVYDRLREAARAVLATEWESYLVAEDRTAFERLREALNA